MAGRSGGSAGVPHAPGRMALVPGMGRGTLVLSVSEVAMATTTVHDVLVPCPVCGTPFRWPATVRCVTCHADLLGPAATEYWQLARDEAALQARRAVLLQELTATAVPAGALASAPTPSPRRSVLTDMRAQTVLGLAGAALLAVAAVVFAAVTWQDLPTVARAAVLVGAAGASAGLALLLDRRSLPMTAGAVGLLADALAATVVWAAHTYGATGELVDAGGGALAALGATVVALGLGRRGIRWQPAGATVAWLGTVALAAVAIGDVTPTAALPLVALGATSLAAAPTRLTAGGPRRALSAAGGLGLAVTSTSAAFILTGTDGSGVVLPVVAGLAAAASWWRFAGPRIGTGAATGGLSALAMGGLATLDLAPLALLGGIAGIALLVAAVATVVPARQRAVLAGSLPASVPAFVGTLGLGVTAAEGWLRQTTTPWRAPTGALPGAEPWLAVMALFTVGAVVLAGVVLAPGRWRTVAGVAAPVGASAATWQLGGSPMVLVLVALIGALVGLARLGETSGRAMLVGWSVVAVGWSVASPSLAVTAAGSATVLAMLALVAPVGRHPEQAAVAVGAGALTAVATIVEFLGSADGHEVAGAVAVGVAVLVAVAGRWTELHPVTTATTLPVVGAIAVVATLPAGLVAAAVAGAVLAVGTASLAFVWREARDAAQVHGLTALAAATSTAWLLLHEAEVTTPEAYTAVPAVLALGAGLAWMARDPEVRSRRALHPGLVLAVVPTLALLVVDPQDTGRALATAGIAAVALLIGVGRRIEAPVWHGVAATGVVVATQLAVAAGHVPRWVVFAVLGALMVTASATFERQRQLAGRLRARIGEVTTTYR